ncbi:MAG TPA: hypothetical protein HPP81_01875 [Deltaproteobacteria bacterium]|jgi:hypothetical protein|nr:hypothetical protein [Deltaproteobacteria bacterium]HIJ75443.1 hypothetical protein [Deltaproteobacteria bacterium]
MPIPAHTKLTAVPGMLAANIKTYNDTHAGYNRQYANYIAARNDGIAVAGSLGAWIASNGATPIQALLNAFGMNAHNSRLVPHDAFQGVLSRLNPLTVNWVAGLALPLGVPPPNLVNAATGETLSAELRFLYNVFAAGGSVTNSGGYVAASKTMHCLFPKLAPIIDGKHTGIAYYNIDSATYDQPLGLDSWARWVGEPIHGKVNPSPRGAGRKGWQWHQFMAAVGVNQHIYELWQVANRSPGLQAFLALDPTPGTNGITRIIDKGLW